MSVDAKLEALRGRGVVIVDPRQTWLDDHVVLDRVRPGAVLHPGTRLLGARTFVGRGAKVGTEGPAVLDDAVLDADAEVASGTLREAVLLRDARVGANAHVRPGTLLEEGASVAHAVGLKHTLLLSFVTVGSLVNLCDALLAGGTSRQDHTEVGSGFIHFNFTPWARSGDKATPSLVGDVVHGVFLRERRIFLGGLSGMVGPQKVGFGSFTVAGQVIRSEVPPNRMHGDVSRKVDLEFSPGHVNAPGRRLYLNLAYIGQLHALRAWYRDVRLRRIPAGADHADERAVVAEAARIVDLCIEERRKRLRDFTEERGLPELRIAPAAPPCPLTVSPSPMDHLSWVKGLSDEDVRRGASWLQAIASSVEAAAPTN